MKRFKAFTVLSTFLAASLMLSSVASATIVTLMPDSNSTGGMIWSGSVPGNPDADDIETITGTGVELIEQYKSDVADPPEESGPYAGDYDTTFANDPLDPADATTVHTGANIIGGTEIYALVKDGNQDPRWYVFEITSWDGWMDLEFRDFWPEQGAISHVSIYSDRAIPEATAALAWSIIIGMGLAYRRRR
jgi:hypothetical protein